MEMTPELVQRFGPLQELGRGACGVVYRLGADRALKVMAFTGDGAREARELEIAQRLRHPHLMPCFEVGIDGQAAWVVMPLASGSLHEVMAEPDRRDRSWDLLRQAAEGVAALHQAGVVHRDLKPANILVIDGQARVADFGMARGGDTATLTATGTIMGTPQYMAPEQARGERATPAADAYALGVIAYEIVEGVTPYPADLGMGELLARVAAGKRDPLQRSRTWLPVAVRQAIDAALSANPAERPADLVAWAKMLGELPEPGADPHCEAATLEVSSIPEATAPLDASSPRPLAAPTPPTPTPPPSAGSRAPWILVLLIGLGIGLFSQRAPQPASPPIASPEQPGPDPTPGSISDPLEHPELQELSRDLNRRYDSLAAPFLYAGTGRISYTSKRIGVHRTQDEKGSVEPFKTLLRETNYLGDVDDHAKAVEKWIARATEVLTPRQLDSEAVLHYLVPRAFYLFHVHEKMLDKRMKHGLNFMLEAALQAQVEQLLREVRGIVGDLRDRLPAALGPRPWPSWGVILAIQLNRIAGRPYVARDLADLAEALGPGLTPSTYSHLASTARTARVSLSGGKLAPCEPRWRIWRSQATASARRAAATVPPTEAMSLLNDWTRLQEECPTPSMQADLDVHLATFDARVMSEIAWLEAQDFQLNVEGVPVLGDPPTTLRAYDATRYLGSLIAGWRREGLANPPEVACEHRRRAVAFGETHPELIKQIFAADDFGSRRAAFRELEGCED